MCPLCGRKIDCAAKPKPYTTHKGREVHWKCLDALIERVAMENL